jgi:hypothetical protein
MEAATWGIKTHKLNHFEKAVKVRDLILSGASCASNQTIETEDRKTIASGHMV